MNDVSDEERCTKCYVLGHAREACEWTSDELYSIRNIAAFIAARLNYVLPECNGPRCDRGREVSTIRVAQHKEKFWYIRIYCTLADDKLVQARWLEDRQHESDGESAPKEYSDKRFMLDAWHYRKCYLDMIQLLPKMKKRIRSEADYAELLFDDEAEMRHWIDLIAQPDPNRPGVDCLSYVRKRYNVETNEGLKSRLSDPYKEPSFRDWRGDA